jgi:hypothetical protein
LSTLQSSGMYPIPPSLSRKCQLSSGLYICMERESRKDAGETLSDVVSHSATSGITSHVYGMTVDAVWLVTGYI